MSDGKEFPSDKADKFVVRFPDGMREKIRVAAEANNRSMNAEIIARLQQTFDEGDPTDEDSRSALHQMVERLTTMEETLDKALRLVVARSKK